MRAKKTGSEILYCGLLIVAGLCLHLPGLDRPLDIAEVNAGAYFGSFVRNYEAHGFWALRGMPLSPQLVFTPAGGEVYVNHPPGLAWLIQAMGGSESAMRLPTVIGSVAAAILLLLLLAPRFGAWRAALAGACVLGAPGFGFWLQASYEPLVLAFGLLLLLSTLRCEEGVGAAAGWRWVQIATCAIGPFLDWAFLFFALGMVPLVWRGAPRRMLVRLVLPAVACALSIGVFFLWRQWALAAPGLAGVARGLSSGELLHRYVLERPGVFEFVSLGGRRYLLANTLLLGLAGLLALPVLLRSWPRMGLALACSAFLFPLVFAHHALDHVHFWGYTTPLLACSLAACATLGGKGLRVVFGLVLVLATGLCWQQTIMLRQRTDTDLFRAIGESLTRAASEGGGLPCQVGTSFPHVYAYYVRTPWVVVPRFVDPVKIEAHRRNLDRRAHGLRYLLIEMAGPVPDFLPDFARRPALSAYLSRFPRRRLRDLEVEFFEPASGTKLRIEEAWLYTLVPP